MKKVRIINIFALIFNLCIVQAVLTGLLDVLSITPFDPAVLLNYPVIIALFAGVAALVNIPFNVLGIVKYQKLPVAVYLLKLTAAAAAMITLVWMILRMLVIPDSPAFVQFFGLDNLASAQFNFYLYLPVFSLLSAILLDVSKPVKFPFALVGCLPTVAWFTYYALASDEYKYFKENIGSTMLIIVIALMAGALVFAILIWLLNRLMAKNYKESPVAASESSEETIPVNDASMKEEKKEEPLPEPAPAPVVEEPKEEKPVKEEKKAEPKPAPKKEEAKKPAKKEEKKPVEKKAAKAAPAKEEKNSDTKVYHLTKRKEDDMWAITFVGGQKAVKLFKTKKEAEEYLETLTKNQGATALIRNSKGAKAGKFASSIKSEDK